MAVAGLPPSAAMRKTLAGIAEAHAGLVRRRLARAPFHPEGRKDGSDYNIHFVDLEADDDTYHAKARAALTGSVTRARRRGAVDHDGSQLHHYWTRDPEGLAKWADTPTPYENLYEHLLSHMDGNEDKAHRTAAAWFHDVFHYWPGSDKNRVAHGKPPRGKRVGPG